MADLKTAKDMPEGSQVRSLATTWTKGEQNPVGCWVSPHRERISDDMMDAVLAAGATVLFITSGRGRWLRKEQEDRRG